MNFENEELFKSIFYRYAKSILIFLTASVSCHEDAEDILQNVFLAFLKGIDDLSMNPDTDYRKWLFAVARNQVLDYYKHKKRHAPPLSYDDVNLQEVISNDVDYTTLIFENDLPSDETIISQILAKLSQNDRELYELVYIKKASYTVLAGIYSTNEPKIRMRISRMKRRITELLKDFLK